MTALMMVALWGNPVQAAEGLEWQWPEAEVRRFRVMVDMKLPNQLSVAAENNKEARVFELATAFDMACVPVRTTSSAFELECDITAAQFNAAALSSDRGLLPGILDEWDQKLVDDAMVHLTLSKDGRVRNVDVKGLNERIQRIRLIKETMHLVMLRTFGAFDLNLPKKGDDQGRPWKQRTQLALQLPALSGMAGSVNINSVVTAWAGSVATIDTTGRGALSVNPLVESGPAPANIFDMEMRSRATFDTATGCLLTRSYIAEGLPTPGSMGAIGKEPRPYIQAGELQYVPDGSQMATLGPNLDTSPK